MVQQIPAVDKAVRLMRLIAGGGGGRSMAELARDLAIAPTTCFRLIKTLLTADWIRQREGGGYAVSAGLLPLVEPLLDLRRTVHLLRPIVDALARDTELTVKLSAREGHEQVTVYRAESPRPMAANVRVEARFGVFVGASGAALLCGLDDAHIQQILDSSAAPPQADNTPEIVWQRVRSCRRNGLALNLDTPGLETLAAPIRDPQEEVRMAITIVGLKGDLGARPTREKELLQVAVKRAEQAWKSLESRS